MAPAWSDSEAGGVEVGTEVVDLGSNGLQMEAAVGDPRSEVVVMESAAADMEPASLELVGEAAVIESVNAVAGAQESEVRAA
jgi:hypothetical protein